MCRVAHLSALTLGYQSFLLVSFLRVEELCMKKRRSFIFGSLAVMMVCATVVLGGDLKSGPQPGTGVTPFDPLNIFNADSPSRNGKESCFI